MRDLVFCWSEVLIVSLASPPPIAAAGTMQRLTVHLHCLDVQYCGTVIEHSNLTSSKWPRAGLWPHCLHEGMQVKSQQ